MNEIYFTSDLHFGHENIVTYCDRPFHDAEDMNEGLILNWNEMVGPNDTVYILGDFAMGRISETLPLALRLNGRKLLVPGNHDRCWAYHSKGVTKWELEYERVGLEVLDSEGVYNFYDLPFKLCHFPYHGDHTDVDRYTFARPKREGNIPLFHGHTHSPDPLFGEGMVNVGVDAWNYSPVHIDTLLELKF